MKTPHPHPEILKAFAADTSVVIERRNRATTRWENVGIWSVFEVDSPYEFRIKPTMRSITLADGTVVEWPEPMRVAPEYGSSVWVNNGTIVVERKYYPTTPWICKELKAGFCHLTEEAAQQHRKAIVAANGGEL